MTKTFTMTQTLEISGITGLDKVKVVVPVTGEYNIDLDFEAEALNQDIIEVSLPHFQIWAFVAQVTTPGISGDVSLLTNDPDTPDNTFPLKTSDPLFWYTGNVGIFDTDIAKLIVKNEGDVAVKVKVRVLLTATD